MLTAVAREQLWWDEPHGDLHDAVEQDGSKGLSGSGKLRATSKKVRAGCVWL